MSKNSINSAKAFIEKLRVEYIKKHIFEQERDELIAENNIEEKDIKGYHGREILELLQNADDAYQKSIDMGEKPDCELVVSIKYIANTLSVTNTGTAFDSEGIKAIIQGNNSPKNGKYIGNKGTGFRSILNWATGIRIFSGEFNVLFSKEIADKEFEKLKNLPQIQKQLKKKPDLYFPMLAIPEYIDSMENNDATTIEVDIDPKRLNDDYSVAKQIANVDLRILMFLPNISQIEIITENGKVIYKRTFFEKNLRIVLLQKIVDDVIETEEKFYLFSKKIEKTIEEDDAFKDVLLSIAVPFEFATFKKGNLYSFFPLLDTDSPFNCVMHASYALGDHRNTITANEANKEIIKKQIDFLFEIVRFFVEKKQFDIAYELLLPVGFQKYNWSFVAPFSKFELEDFYLNNLLEQKIFASVNDDNLSIKDGIKIIHGDYPAFFRGKEFNSLIKPTRNEKVEVLLDFVAEKKGLNIYYFENELLEIINCVTDSWGISQRVSTFVWWNTFFQDSLPNLLKKQNRKWLEYDEECFFLIGKFENDGLPSWVRIPALDKEYQNELFRITESNRKFLDIRVSSEENRVERIICQNNLYPSVSFKYRDVNNIITAVNSSVTTYEQAVDFVKWLWKSYGKKEMWNPPGQSENSEIKYRFPSIIEKNIVESGKLYFGSDYDNILGEKLFDDTYRSFPPITEFGVNSNEKHEFIEFVSKFGVKKYPVIESQEIITPIDSYHENLKEEIMANGDVGYSSYISCKYKLPFIKNLEDILERLSTIEVIEWIYKDSLLFSNLCNPYVSDADVRYWGNLQQRRDRKYFGKVENYILAVFNECKWIEINCIRYSPKQILQNFKSRNNQKFGDLIPILNIEILEKISQDINLAFEDVFDIFSIFDFADKVTDLSSNDFYGLLLELPSVPIEESGELSKQIYRIVEQKSFSKDYENSDNKKKFFLEGKVLVKYQGQLQYWDSKDAVLPSTKIINKKNYPIIEKGGRTNNENFVRVFGCKEKRSEYKVVHESIILSDANSGFQEYYKCFNKYARAYDEKNENIEKYGNAIKITLVNRIAISDNDCIESIEDEYVCIRDTMTNWYITVRGSDFSINSVSEMIELIYSNIANTPGYDANKIGELFRNESKENREFLIMKEFGTLNVIEDSYYKNAIKNNFIKTINKISSGFDINEIEIDFENFSDINNISSLIMILKKLNVDVEDFKEAGFVYSLDLIPYYKKEVEEFILKEKERFKNVLFSRAQKDAKLQQCFLNTVYNFENFNVFAIYKNTVDFDVENEIINRFGEWRCEDYVSADDKYSENYREMNPEKLFEDELANDQNVKRMIYFKCTEEFENWLREKTKQNQASQELIEVDNYAQYRDIVPACQNITFSNPRISKRHSYKSGSSRNAYIESVVQKQNRKQKILGNKGELLVYNYLCSTYGEENVVKKSEAFVELGLLVPGQAVSGEYDLSYKDENGSIHFVEVKTGDNHSFVISPKELQFAESHEDKYEVFLVFDIDSEKPYFTILPHGFWNDSKFKRNDIVERIEFEF